MTQCNECFDELQVRMNDASPTMFGATRWHPDSQYDVVFVGVPTDTGGLGHRTTASAPAFLRTVSSLFPVANDAAGQCVGWFDYVTGETLLEGVRMADVGDFACARGGGSAQLESLPEVYRALRATARQMVVLGGDHSIAYFLGRSLRDEAMVWVDAHEDAGSRQGPLPNCANVVTYLDGISTIPLIAQFGLRGIVPANRGPVPPHRKLCATTEAVVAALRENNVRRAAVSIDVDVLDPCILPAVGSALPEGLTPADLLALLKALSGAGIFVPVIELAEFAPSGESDVTSALVLINFLLRALSLCHGIGAGAQ